MISSTQIKTIVTSKYDKLEVKNEIFVLKNQPILNLSIKISKGLKKQPKAENF